METYRNVRDYKLREAQKGKGSQKNKNDKTPEEPIKWAKSSGAITGVFFWVSQAWRTKTWSSLFCPFPWETALILIAASMRPRTQVADGVSLKMWLQWFKFAEWAVSADAARGAADWRSAVRPGQGQANPVVPLSAGKLFVFCRGVSWLEVKGQHVSLYLYCEFSTGHVFLTRNHFTILTMTFPSPVDLPNWCLSECDLAAEELMLVPGGFCILCHLAACWLNVMQSS